MSQELTGKTEAQIADIVAFVETEAESTRKAIKVQSIVLAVVSIVLIIYFAVFNKYVKSWTEPKDLAVVAVRLVDDNSPSFAKVLEDMLRSAAPQVAEFVAQRAVKDGVPFLVRSTESYLNDYATTIAKETAAQMEAGFNQALLTNKAELIKVLQENQNSDNPDFALNTMREALQKSFVAQTTRPNTKAKKAIASSLLMLKNMARRIRTLSTMDPKDMSKNERMADRLLRYQWMWLRQPLPTIEGKESKEHDDEPLH